MNLTVTPSTAVLNLSPEAFHLYAYQHWKCKKDFKLPYFSPLPFYLLCRALELELKSRHLFKKTQKQVKKRYGHKLNVAYADLDNSQKILSLHEEGVLKQASDIYSAKDFEYFSPTDAISGNKRYPKLTSLESITQKLIEDSQLHTSEFKKTFCV